MVADDEFMEELGVTTRGKVYYVAPMLDFCKNNASVFRVLNICRILKSNGNLDVSVLGKSTTYDEYEAHGIWCRNLRHGAGILSKMIYLFTFPYVLLRMIKRMENPDAVITYNLYGFPLFILMRYCKRNHIKIISDAVEWYEYSFLKNKLQIPGIHWTMTRLNKRVNGLIAISRFLETYYKPFVRTLFLPPIFQDNYYLQKDLNNGDLFDSRYLNLIYAGVSGKKDLLNHVIEGVKNVSGAGRLVRLHIIGTTKYALEKMYNIELDDSSISCYGHMTHDALLFYLCQADFSVILRHEDLRYAKAGFSTKFVESLCCGLPVIANLSGDMGDYLKNDYNGYVVAGHNAGDFAAAITFILDHVSADHYRGLMKSNAFRTFTDNFSATVHADRIADYLNSILKND